MNVSATFNVFNLLRNPSLCLPHATVPTFDRVPFSIAPALTAANGGQRPDIRAVVLDKDNCFAKPKSNSIHRPYKVRPFNITGLPPPHTNCQSFQDLVPDLLNTVRKEQQDKAF